MTVSVSKVIYGVDGSRHVFRATDTNGFAARYVADDTLPRCPSVGECWDLEWVEEEHPNFGPQRKVTAGRLERPAGELVIHVLSGHPSLRGLGVGRVMATQLYRKHGPRLADILRSADVAALDDLDESVAAELCERWNLLDLEPDVVRWMDEHGLDARSANKIISLYGAQSVVAMETNPYVLLPFMDFAQVDRIATAYVGVQPGDPRRQIAAVETILYREIDAGHTAMARTTLEKEVGHLLPVGVSSVGAVDMAISSGVTLAHGPWVQAYAPAFMEREIERWIAAVLHPSSEQVLSFDLPGGTDIEVLLEEICRTDGTPITDEQRAAVLGVVRNRLHCISGGAGVGKTTVLRLVAKLIRRIGGIACFVAISGRASRRIREALGDDLGENCHVSTIASFLKTTIPLLSPSSAPWVIVDEASMLDLQNAYRIIERSPSGLRLTLVGDPNQLPPVGAGLVFHRLVHVSGVPHTTLWHVFRQAAATGIPSFAAAVRDGVVPPLLPFVESGVGVQVVSTIARDAVGAAITVYDALAAKGAVQMLTVFRTTAGAADVNAVMHARLPSVKSKPESMLDVAVDEPVIFTKNDRDLDLQNGSMGRVTRVDSVDGSLDVLWDDGRKRKIRDLAVGNCELAYAVTTHKGQGSQWERVVIVVPRSAAILDRSLLYTAITRAQKQAVLVGDEAAIRSAIQSPSTAHRRNVLLFNETLTPPKNETRR